jgi:hypothetical protein
MYLFPFPLCVPLSIFSNSLFLLTYFFHSTPCIFLLLPVSSPHFFSNFPFSLFSYLLPVSLQYSWTGKGPTAYAPLWNDSSHVHGLKPECTGKLREWADVPRAFRLSQLFTPNRAACRLQNVSSLLNTLGWLMVLQQTDLLEVRSHIRSCSSVRFSRDRLFNVSTTCSSLMQIKRWRCLIPRDCGVIRVSVFRIYVIARLKHGTNPLHSPDHTTWSELKR